ncbi:MAG TPA: peptidylprolyl isomerase [Myxococcota bacterium]|nr:peptidylprolyl isomerase [Myxococcota bacterium]
MLLSLLLSCSGQPEPTSVPVAKDGEPRIEKPATPAAEPEVPTASVPTPADWNATAPANFDAVFETSKGSFTVSVDRSWSPTGADRFYNLVDNGYYDDIAFFRNIDGFMVQFGIHGDPAFNTVWKDASILDDAVTKSNRRTFVSFATSGKNSRTTQIFINFGDNSSLDGMGFSPFGQITDGMEVVDSLYNGYGEGSPRGRGPDQGKLQKMGNAYLKTEFPKLDYVTQASIRD